LVKFSNTFPQSLWGFVLCATPHGTAQRIIIGTIQTQRLATPETDELGNGREDGRGAAIRQERNGRGNNRKFNARSGFNPDCWRGEWHGNWRDFNFPMRNANYRAIIVVFGNGATMQPRMQWRAKLRCRHEQPQHQRQNRRRGEEPFANAPFDWIYQLQTICF
jgi:hypothetical protein